MEQAKILFLDIESGGINALHSDLGFVIVFGYKWGHEKKAHSIILDQKHLDSFDDSELLKEASKLIEEADLLVGHFSSVFDRRFIQGRLIINNLPPIPNTKMRDTCFISRSAFNFSSNRLKNLAKVLNLKNQKLENSWPKAWIDILKGDMNALKDTAKYCEGDVLCVEELYNKLSPFDNAHPRLVTDRTLCGLCGGAVQYRGYSLRQERRYRRYQCTKCARWGQETKAI